MSHEPMEPLELQGTLDVSGVGVVRTKPLSMQVHSELGMDVFGQARDYIDLERGVEPTRELLREYIEARPPQKTLADKCTLVWVDEQGRGVGYLDLLRGYPHETDLYIGLLMLVPRVRSAGLGRAVVQWLVHEAEARGFTRLLTGPVESNPKGLAFWRREGFEAVRSVPDQTAGERTHTVHIVAKALGGAAS